MTTHDSRRFLLEEALHKAKDAVFFDNHQHYEDAIIKYGNSCALLGQVMRTHLEDDDKRKIEAIVSVSVCNNSARGYWLTPNSEPPTCGGSMSFKTMSRRICTSFEGGSHLNDIFLVFRL